MATEYANPLFVQWLQEVYDVARERASKGENTARRALNSMKACTLTFTHPAQAEVLVGIGPKNVKMLTTKLEEHCATNGLPMPKKINGKKRTVDASAEENVEDAEAAPVKKPRKRRPYVPGLRSGPYGLILALSSLDEDSGQGLTKMELQALAQPHCDSSYSVPSEANKMYTAWSSMKTLEDKDLVYAKGRPSKRWLLTEEGWDVAKKIRSLQEKANPASIGTSKPLETNPASMPKISSSTKDPAYDFLDLEDESEADTATLQPRSGHAATRRLHSSEGLDRRHGDEACISNQTNSTADAQTGKDLTSEFVTLSSSPEPSVAPVPRIETSTSTHPSTSIQGSERHYSSNQLTLEHTTSNTSSTCSGMNDPTRVVPSIPVFDPLILQPGTFTVHLVLDNREVRTKTDRDYIQTELAKQGITPLVRALEVGDFYWIAKLHDPHLLARHGEEASDELALDWIAERKRLDDLVGSITDGRYAEQKFRLRKTGTAHVVYLIEDFSLSSEKETRFHEAINSAIASSQVVEGFTVKRTPKLDHTIRYIARLTRMLRHLYEAHPLHLIPSRVLTPQNHLPLLAHLRTHADHSRHRYTITYESFKSLASKSDTLTLRDVFLKMLMCTRGISGEKALAIQKVWRTPRAMMDAYEACATQKEREGLVEKMLDGVVGRAKVKGVLSAKVAGIWGQE